MLITTPISVGELLDKISILRIKEKKIADSQKQNHIKKELRLLNLALEKTIQTSENQELKKKLIDAYIKKLIDINTQLWNIEDSIRECERNDKFDQKFIDLARSVYLTNDKRSEIKLEINNKFGSSIVEIKSYEKY